MSDQVAPMPEADAQIPEITDASQSIRNARFRKAVQLELVARITIPWNRASSTTDSFPVAATVELFDLPDL